jgi:hypothetical protein
MGLARNQTPRKLRGLVVSQGRQHQTRMKLSVNFNGQRSGLLSLCNSRDTLSLGLKYCFCYVDS